MNLYLFGAGASFGSGECYPSTPPLGGDLFRSMRSSSRVLQSLTSELAERFNTTHFEDGMKEFTKTRPRDRDALLRDMATYLLQFVPGPTNHYGRLLRHLKNTGADFVFASLNYDLLIELSANSAGFEYFGYTPGNSDRAGRLRIIKPHGSVNIAPDLGSGSVTGVRWSSSGRSFEGPVRVLKLLEARAFWSSDTSLAPVMAMYSAGKEVMFCPSFVAEQQNQWRTAVKSASEVVIIGTRVWPSDKHIWEPIAEAPGMVTYVGKTCSPFQEWAQKNRSGPSQFVPKTFGEFVESVAAVR
jgi:hypothetical protein